MKNTIEDTSYRLPDSCSCCQLTTGGEHNMNCPNYIIKPRIIWPYVIIRPEITLSYPEHVAELKRVINDPERPVWGVRQI